MPRKSKDVTTEDKPATMVIMPPKFRQSVFTLIGTTPYMQAKFSAKAKNAIREKHEKGSQAKKGKGNREPRNFDDDYEQAKHLDANGRCGIPVSAFRNAMISACRLVGFKMTLAKLSVFVEADSVDAEDGTPLVWIDGTAEKNMMHTRNATGVCDLRVRPMWRSWSTRVKMRWDADQFGDQDVLNLLVRVGQQVGLGEGRPDSRNSAGLGLGTFRVAAMTEASDVDDPVCNIEIVEQPQA